MVVGELFVHLKRTVESDLDKGSILRNSISAEYCSDKFPSLDKVPPKKTTDVNVSKYRGKQSRLLRQFKAT
jgi:hypothetical protein